jgi:hypothetical protein
MYIQRELPRKKIKTKQKKIMTFQSVGDFVRKEQQLTVQLESEQFWSSLENSIGNSVGKFCW